VNSKNSRFCARVDGITTYLFCMTFRSVFPR